MNETTQANSTTELQARANPPSTPKPKTSEQMTLVLQQPLKIEVDTPTDWPAVTAPLVLGLAVAYFTFITQRIQVRSAAANIRHTWIQELRTSALDYIGGATEMSWGMRSDEDFPLKAEARILWSRIISAQGKILLMLDPQQPYTESIQKTMRNVDDAISERNYKKLHAAIYSFSKETQKALESGWSDIKRDLHVGKSKRKKELSMR